MTSRLDDALCDRAGGTVTVSGDSVGILTVRQSYGGLAHGVVERVQSSRVSAPRAAKHLQERRADGLTISKRLMLFPSLCRAELLSEGGLSVKLLLHACDLG